MRYSATLRTALAAVLAIGTLASTSAQATHYAYYPYPAYAGYYPGYYPGFPLWRPGYALPPYAGWVPVPPALIHPHYPLPPYGHWYGKLGRDLLLFGPGGLVRFGHPNFFPKP